MSAATETQKPENGTAPEQTIEEVSFPVESFRDAAKHLRRPFTANAVKFKVQTQLPAKGEPKGALIVAYIDARLVVERLNLVCPQLWYDRYELIGKSLICHLTVDGITRSDVGGGYEGKGLYSDALKRAAVKFGVGVPLYATPQMIFWLSDGRLLEKRGDDKVALTDLGKARCRDLYRAWLEGEGEQKFGKPLDHGDVEESVGDPEEIQAPAPDSDPAPEKLVGKVVDLAWKLKVQKHLQLAASRQHGSDVGDCSTKAKAKDALAKLTIAELDDLNDRLTAKAEQKGGESNG